MIVRSVRVGIPVLGAINAVAREAQAPTAAEFAKLGNELAVGVPLDQAVVNMAVADGAARIQFFATAFGLQAQTGGGLSETLENLADLSASGSRCVSEGMPCPPRRGPARLMLGALPVVMGGGLWLLNPAYMGLLFNTSMGHKYLGCGRRLAELRRFRDAYHHQQEPIVRGPLLLSSAGVGACLFIALAFVLLREIQRQQRLSRRVQMSRGVPPPKNAAAREVLQVAWTRFVSMLGQLMLRSGLVSARTRAELELTLASAGLRGRAASNCSSAARWLC